MDVQCDQKGRCQKYLLITPKIFESQKYFIPFWFAEYLTFMMVCLPNIFFQKKCIFYGHTLNHSFVKTWSFYILVMVIIFFLLFWTIFCNKNTSLKVVVKPNWILSFAKLCCTTQIKILTLAKMLKCKQAKNA